MRDEIGLHGDDRLEVLRRIKREGWRKPEIVKEFGLSMVRGEGAGFSSVVEFWDILEMVAIACMDLGEVEIASELAKKTFNQFPSSQRALRLAIMIHEAKGEWSEALKQYQTMLDSDPFDAKTWKRKVCVLKSSGDTEGAAAELGNYLNLFPLDISAWAYLSELSLARGDLPSCKFALEELILLEPQNYLVHLKYADVLYTINAKLHAETARTYYSQALELAPKNLRALFGICQCLQISVTSSRLSKALHKWARSEISRLYQDSPLRHTVSLVIEE